MPQDEGVSTSTGTSPQPRQGYAAGPPPGPGGGAAVVQPPAAGAPAPQRPPFVRSVADGVAGGVCAGLARHLGLPVVVVRVAMVLLTVVAGGSGFVLYAVLWAITPSDQEVRLVQTPAAHRAAQRRITVHHWLVIGGLLLVIAGLSLGTTFGSWVANVRYLIPVLAIAGGAFVAWYQLDDPVARRGGRARSRWAGLVQVLVGLALATGGVVVLVTRGQAPREVWNGALAAIAVLAGATVIAAPFALRLWRRAQREEAERVRVTERADIAAHLHDSVLQTLALIQRRAEDPTTVQRLARRQERELRQWLYGAPEQESDSLAAALTAEINEVEDEHGVPVELVVTGDAVVDEADVALVRATREAVLNAVRHGRPPVSVYVEIGPGGTEVFVRDHGPGFDLDGIGEDRMGVRESILGRMTRAGGSARIRRLDDGTEVALTLPPPPEPERAEGEPSRSPGASGRHTVATKESTP